MAERPVRWLRAVCSGVVIVLAVRAAYLSGSYLNGSATTLRFHVESACLLFALGGAARRLGWHQAAPSCGAPAGAVPGWSVLAWIVAASFLYWPAVSVGFLSDDYGLVARAWRMDLTWFNSEAFRPVPLAIWGALLRLGASPRAFHLLNICAHGVNAYLTTRIADRYVPSKAWSILAGFIFLTLPIATEAVVWCAGVFDVTATVCALACLLIARSYGSTPSLLRRVGLFAVAMAGLGSKETAVVIGPLICLDAWGRSDLRRPVLIDASVLTALSGLYGFLRLSAAASGVKKPITRYLLQRFLFETFSGLGVPWHREFTASFPWIACGAAFVILLLSTVFFLRSGSTTTRTRAVLACTGFILLPVLPAISFLYVSPTLEGGRFLYMSSFGWAALLVALGAPETGMTRRSWHRVWPVALLTLLALAGIAGVRVHLRFWKAAADLRDRVEAAAASDPRFERCTTLSIAGLPDSVAGAYVFRNSAPEALDRDLGLNASVGSGSGPCAFKWTPDGFERPN